MFQSLQSSKDSTTILSHPLQLSSDCHRDTDTAGTAADTAAGSARTAQCSCLLVTQYDMKIYNN